MGKAPEIVGTVAELRARLTTARQASERVGLVPTMGALHEGHLSLVRQTKARCGATVVSIFVNPAQFGPNEDFARYPRTFDSDCAKLAGFADLIFAPSAAEMYPDGFATRIEVSGPALGLESDFRPHFFSGVTTVVAKLLIAVMPDEAIFGEKDYQQLLVIRRLVTDLALPIEIVAGRTVREADGLAMSSRNAYLSPEERRAATVLHRALRAAETAISEGERRGDAVRERLREVLNTEPLARVEYAEVVNADSFRPVETLSGRLVLPLAVRIGGTRLIDNIRLSAEER